MRPFVLSIAGYDPSGGAGVLADAKVFEQIGVQGLLVTTCITYQTEDSFLGIKELSLEEILGQLNPLLEKYRIKYCKIGLFPNLKSLETIVNLLAEKKIKIILDPVLSASAGFDFHKDYKIINSILSKVFIITPNTQEVKLLSNIDNVKEAAKKLSKKTRLLLKGGHKEKNKGVDDLFMFGKLVESYHPWKMDHYEKHGSGCILSTAITSLLALNFNIYESILHAKEYLTRCLTSNVSLLAYHNSNTISYKLPHWQYITQGENNAAHLLNIEKAFYAGCEWVQLRIKNEPFEVILNAAEKAKAFCDHREMKLCINDNVEIAKAIKADAVHLGKNDMLPKKARKILGTDVIIGGTANTFEDILRLAEQQVDYIGLGPYKFTTTKRKLSPILGVEGYREIMEKMEQYNIRIPTFAIGGIEEKDFEALEETGVYGIAISGLLTHHKNAMKLGEKIEYHFSQ